MKFGREKLQKLNLDKTITLQYGDAETCDLPDNSMDAITVGFGVRNFENLEKGLKEIYRVLKPGGYAVVLEFSKPQQFPFKQIYSFYFKFILPKVGSWLSKDNSAYQYLPESVDAFPYGNAFLNVLSQAGFSQVKAQNLTFGISSIYTGKK